jgi:NAD(P)-dependent dehydrogenase (short-subunit alcohol dehydrogenase family)
MKDQVAIVTGGAVGIGGATSRRLAEEGARVLVVDVDAAGAQRNVETIRASGGEAEPLEANVATEDGVRRAIETALQHWRKLNIIVNNAFHGTGPGGAVDVTEEAWDAGMNVGLKAMFRTARYGVPEIRKAGGGAIVNLSSVHGLLAAPRSLVYETLKAGVIGLTRQMAVDYGPDGIRVNAVCPGMIQTERMQRRWVAHPESLAFYEQQYPVRRTGTPLDIANAIVFLCSEEASFITGHALVVDGGLTIQLQENIGVHLGQWIQQHPDTTLPG